MRASHSRSVRFKTGGTPHSFCGRRAFEGEGGTGRFLYFPIPCPRSYVWNYETCSNIKRVILLNEGTAMKKRCSCQARPAKRINFQRRDRRATKIISGTTAATAEELSGKRGGGACKFTQHCGNDSREFCDSFGTLG